MTFGIKPKIKHLSKVKELATNSPCTMPYLYTNVNKSTVTTSIPDIPLNANCPPISNAVNTPGNIIFFAEFI